MNNRYEIIKIQSVNDLYLGSPDENEPNGMFFEKIHFLVFYVDREFDNHSFVGLFPVTDIHFEDCYIELEGKIGLRGKGRILHKRWVPEEIISDLK